MAAANAAGISTVSAGGSCARRNMELFHGDATQHEVDMFFMKHCDESVDRLRTSYLWSFFSIQGRSSYHPE
jgi:hypothetical protein